MHKKILYLLSVLTVGAALATGAAAAERGIVTVNSRLNVRTAPSTAAAVVCRLYDGETVTLHGQTGGWWYTEYAPGAFGYVSADYIRTLDGASAPRAVSLAVPSYKQTDSAYAGLRLPGSRERISTHGCAVTSLAMAESYRTGRTVTPKTVLAEQRFTATGAIYWPSRYVRGGTRLAEIYDRLAAGNPVIIHVQKKNGSSHFAVVNGFTGGALTAKNFTILDPGSQSRTTLADLYAVYPVAVKTLS